MRWFSVIRRALSRWHAAWRAGRAIRAAEMEFDLSEYAFQRGERLQREAEKWKARREAFACAHLVEAMEAGLLAPAPLWTDTRTFPGRRFRGCVDGVVGGIPCQPHSLAGQKRGSDDERDLWSAFRRILVQTGAWWCLVENVAGMLSAGSDEIAGAERVL